MKDAYDVKLPAMYRMPAEWEPHLGTWIAWPHNKDHWPGKFEPIPSLYGKIVRSLLSGGEKVFILVQDKQMEMEARELIKAENGDIRFFHFPTNSSWTRDFGPIFVRDEKGNLIITDWEFNMWGGKYPPWDLDNAIPQRISQELHIPAVRAGMILEGGSIDVNGRGTLLTTRQCLLNKNRNPDLSQIDIEKNLQDYLGATNVIWLDEGIVGDDTDGHIDDLARFVHEETILCQAEENPQDENSEILKRCFDVLSSAQTEKGGKFNVIPFPMPDPVIYEGQRLPASYANFYIANKAVLLPTFQCSKDKEVISIFEKLFPARRVIPIDAVDYVWGLGTLHCSTQQHPL